MSRSFSIFFLSVVITYTFCGRKLKSLTSLMNRKKFLCWQFQQYYFCKPFLNNFGGFLFLSPRNLNSKHRTDLKCGLQLKAEKYSFRLFWSYVFAQNRTLWQKIHDSNKRSFLYRTFLLKTSVRSTEKVCYLASKKSAKWAALCLLP